ncbi:MAG: pyruvate ferredoxin oxidoreductase, partial [Alphaproteobacteria bacterium]|nr:pyruvate ferredoxin oxidoreductase [Alphaproteobacteria bacterium]
AMAHNIPYVATASVADLHDLEAKVTKAMSFRGARYIHIMVPCPLGWGSASDATIRVARLAVESGIFPLFEAEYGEITASNKIRRQVPVSEYLKLQRRFAHLFKKGPEGEEDTVSLDRLQQMADANIARFNLIDDGAPQGTPQ